MKVTYWCAECLDDSKAYNIRERRKRDVVERLKDLGWPADGGSAYSKPFKVETEFDDVVDLLQCAMGEGGGWWETHPDNVWQEVKRG